MIGACTPDPARSDASQADASRANLAPLSPLEQVGAGIVLALRDSASRSWVLEQANKSPFVEHRIPLRRLMLADSSAELRKILRNAGITNNLA
jgi:hypothetical protein